MDNQRIEFTPEVIAQQRAICDAATPGPWATSVSNEYPYDDIGSGLTGEHVALCGSKIENSRFIVAARTVLPAALDALEAALAENGKLKDALSRPEQDYLDEIVRLTAERDAEKKRADALDPAIEDMKQALCCGGFGELSAACSELWRIWDQNDPEFAEHTDAPTGAESEQNNESES